MIKVLSIEEAVYLRYFIDYENVGTLGLIGLETLTETDLVRLYYSNDPGVAMETVIKIKNTPAKFQFLKLPNAIKLMNLTNALDIVILTDLYRVTDKLSDNCAIIISCDKGYDPAIAEMNATLGAVRVFRFPNLLAAHLGSKAPSPQKIAAAKTQIDTRALDALFQNVLKQYAPHRDMIVSVIRSSRTRSEINARMNQVIKGEEMRAVMKAIKPIIKDLPGN